MAGTCGRFRLFLDKLGCVYMLDGAVDSSIDRAFSQEGRAVDAGLPVPEPQRVALQIFQAKLDYGLQLQAVRRPRKLNVRSDYLSCPSEQIQHACRPPSLFRWLDEH